MDAKDRLESLLDSYNNIFRMCYNALAADAPQEQRDALRESLNDFLEPSDTEE